MKMWSTDVLILLLFCYASLSTANGRVRFVSINFNNVLHWDPAAPSNSEEKLFYTVHYWSDVSKDHQVKKECQMISALTCDLTDETPPVPDVHYYAKVLLSNGSQLGRNLIKFKPIAETTLGAPNLTVHPGPSSLSVNVTLPLGPKGKSVADSIRESKRGPSKTVIVYTLTITEPEWAAQTAENDNGQFVINLTSSDAEYCGYVFYRPNAEWGRDVSERESFCTTLPGHPHAYFPWIYTGAALLAALVVGLLGWTCHYVRKSGKKSDMPQSLMPLPGNQCHVMQPPDEHMVISSPVVGVVQPPTVYAGLQFQHRASADGLGGYSPQDIPFSSWPESSAGSSQGSGSFHPNLKHLEVSGQSSDIYSAVVQVPVEEEEENSHQADKETCVIPEPFEAKPWERGGPKVPAFPDGDDCENRALLVRVERDTNGQLVLPSLTLQLESCTDLHPQSKPRLSDLIEGPQFNSFDSSEWSDSGCDDGAVNSPSLPYCNSSYIANHRVPRFQQQGGTSPIFQSGYKQNWMPAILQDADLTDSCENRRTSSYQWPCTLPEEEEGDEDGGSRPIVLGTWLVRIQD